MSESERPLTRAEFDALILEMNSVAVAATGAVARIDARRVELESAFEDWSTDMDSRHRKMMDYISTVDAKFAALITAYVDHRHGRPESGAS